MDKAGGPRRIVVGQHVTAEKKIVSRGMRHEMTRAEMILWERLRNRQVGNAKFRRQQIIAGFIADFYCHEHALVIEVDGSTHEAQHDAERDAVFQGKGISTLRVMNTGVLSNIETVIERIENALRN
jgi:very-short-patch-repair endonuclease